MSTITIIRKHPTVDELASIKDVVTVISWDGSLVLSEGIPLTKVLHRNRFPIVCLEKEITPLLLDKNVFFVYSKAYGVGITKFKELYKTLPPYWWYNKSICAMLHNLLKDEFCFFIIGRESKMKIYFFFESEWSKGKNLVTNRTPVKTPVVMGSEAKIVCWYCTSSKKDNDEPWHSWNIGDRKIDACNWCYNWMSTGGGL